MVSNINLAAISYGEVTNRCPLCKLEFAAITRLSSSSRRATPLSSEVAAAAHAPEETFAVARTEQRYVGDGDDAEAALIAAALEETVCRVCGKDRRCRLNTSVLGFNSLDT